MKSVKMGSSSATEAENEGRYTMRQYLISALALVIVLFFPVGSFATDVSVNSFAICNGNAVSFTTLAANTTFFLTDLTIANPTPNPVDVFFLNPNGAFRLNAVVGARSTYAQSFRSPIIFGSPDDPGGALAVGCALLSGSLGPPPLGDRVFVTFSGKLKPKNEERNER